VSWADAAWILAAGGGTAVGGLALLVLPRANQTLLDVLLGFTAGVMLAATAFSLLVPALDEGTVAEVVVGLVLGAATLALVDWLIPHAHAQFREEHLHHAAWQRGTLLLTALTIHNVPEGLAVGVAFAAGGPELGIPIAIAIGLQNVPEGFVAAAPFVGAGMRRGRAAAIAAATGLVEPPAAFAAVAAFSVASVLLPVGLAFAGGAMLYVVVDELVPESHAAGNERAATGALIVGFALMLALDNAFS
jgi:ZIP family zinc transporter